MTSDRLAQNLPPAVVEGLLEVMLAEPGSDTIRSAIKQACALIGATCCFVSEFSRKNPGHARFLALWHNGRFVETFEYPLEGTPCAELLGTEVFLVEAGVQARFPEDEWLVQVGAESYAGVRLWSTDGHHLGHFAILDSGPLDPELFEGDTFRLFAALVRAELESRHSQACRIEAERKLLEGQRLQSLGVLAGGVAHDFNNLLVGITGNTELAMRELRTGSTARPFLREIETATNRATDLAQHMLAYSGKGRFTIADADLRPLIAQTLALLRVSIPESVRVQTEFAEDSPTVRIDATQIGQIVMNLVLNAIDALDDSTGTVVISTGTVEVDRATLDRAVIGNQQSPGKRVYLQVADDGAGMTDTVRDRIFEPFFTDKPSGRGLGLAAVHGIVEGHQGALLLETSPGGGTVFRLLLPPGPATSTTDLDDTDAQPTAAATQRPIVLLVDDDVTVRSATTSMLEHLDCQVLTATDGLAGVVAFQNRTEDIDLIILDVTMPRMNGEQALHAIYELDPTARIVLASGYDECEEIAARVGDKLAGFLQKPFGLKDLEKQVHALRG